MRIDARDVRSRGDILKAEKMKRVRRVTEVEKKEPVKSIGYYESKGMTKEDKETGSSITPQEAFRKEMAQMAKSKQYQKLQNTSIDDKKEEKKKTSTKEQEVEQDEKY